MTAEWDEAHANWPKTFPGGLYLQTMNFAFCERTVPAGQSEMAQATLSVFFQMTFHDVSIVNVPRDEGPYRGEMTCIKRERWVTICTRFR